MGIISICTVGVSWQTVREASHKDNTFRSDREYIYIAGVWATYICVSIYIYGEGLYTEMCKILVL